MSLEALLTFFGILLAVLAIVTPVQRHSLGLFVPRWRLPLAIGMSLALIVCRDAPLGMHPLFGWPLSKVMFSLTLAAFVVPVSAAFWDWLTWRRARLTEAKMLQVEELFKAALREHEFDEVDRILRNNREKIPKLPPAASAILFDHSMVGALVESHSLIHLELLANVQFLKSLDNRFQAVEALVREFLRSGVSPLRSAVVSEYGGLEPFTYPECDRQLIKRTFQNPEWYVTANAHYPLAIVAWETLRRGTLDAEYNDIGRDYEADQGISKRVFCPIYLALKTQVLAIREGLRKRTEGDFYVSNLFDAFRFVQERSKFQPAIWKNSLTNPEFPTPYAYLLHSIVSDLEDLACTAVQSATSGSGLPIVANPDRVARDIARTWSFCIWSIAKSQGQVSQEFRTTIIREYLVFILKLGWGPSEIYLGSSAAVEGLDEWRDLFTGELKKRFVGREFSSWTSLVEAELDLDQGKHYVSAGSPWLEKEMSSIL